jgi:hypothetical protein
MRVHSNLIEADHVYRAARYAGVTVHDLGEHGSRSRTKAFNFWLSGSGMSGGQWGRSNGEKSATWDEWGIVINQLYLIDSLAHYGAHSYQDAEHFHWRTGDRFKTLQPSEQHIRHRWDWKDADGRAYNDDLDTCYENRCHRCGAINRWERSGFKWALDRAAMLADVTEYAP